MKRVSDSWQSSPGRGETESPSVERASHDEGGGWLRRWRLTDGQMQFLRYLVLLLAVGVVLMTLNSRAVDDVGTKPVNDVPSVTPPAAGGTAGPAADYARAVEQQVKEALLQLHGVGNVHVAVTLSTGTEQVLAEHVTTERRVSETAASGDDRVVVDERTTAQPVLVRSDQNRQEHPIVLVERTPIIQGVLVVTDAAVDSRIRYELTRSVMTLLGLPAHRVYVLPQRW